MTPEQLNTLTAKLDADPATLDSNRLIELCVLARTLPQAGAAYAAKLAGHLKTRFPAATIAQDVDFAALGKLCAGLGHPVLPADEQKTALESALNTDLATVDFDRLVELGLLYLAVSSILPLWPDTLAAELERRYPAAALEADDSEYSILASLLQQMRLGVSYFVARLDDYTQAADKTAWHAAHQDWFATAVQQPDNLSWLRMSATLKPRAPSSKLKYGLMSGTACPTLWRQSRKPRGLLNYCYTGHLKPARAQSVPLSWRWPTAAYCMTFSNKKHKRKAKQRSKTCCKTVPGQLFCLNTEQRGASFLTLAARPLRNPKRQWRPLLPIVTH